MFCPQCGNQNADNALVCTQCGRSLQAAPPPAVLQPGVSGTPMVPAVTVPNYLVFAILTTVLCCLPFGIPAIVYAAQVNTKLQVGDIAGAQAASKNAKMWCLIAFGVGLAGILLYILMIALGVVSSLHNN